MTSLDLNRNEFKARFQLQFMHVLCTDQVKAFGTSSQDLTTGKLKVSEIAAIQPFSAEQPIKKMQQRHLHRQWVCCRII